MFINFRLTKQWSQTSGTRVDLYSLIAVEPLTNWVKEAQLNFLKVDFSIRYSTEILPLVRSIARWSHPDDGVSSLMTLLLSISVLICANACMG